MEDLFKSQGGGELSGEEKIKSMKILIQKKKQQILKIDDKFERRKRDYFNIRMKLEELPSYYSVPHLYYRREEIKALRGALEEYNREDEIEAQIKGLFHRLTNGRRTSLAQEKRILKEIEALKEQHPSVCANVELEAKKWIYIQDNSNPKEPIQARLKVIFEELRGSLEDQKEFNYKTDKLNKKLHVIEKYITSLEKKLDRMDKQVHKLNVNILQLKKKKDDKPCFINREIRTTHCNDSFVVHF